MRSVGSIRFRTGFDQRNFSLSSDTARSLPFQFCNSALRSLRSPGAICQRQMKIAPYRVEWGSGSGQLKAIALPALARPRPKMPRLLRSGGESV